MSGQGSATKKFRDSVAGKTKRKRRVQFENLEEKVPTDINTQECNDEGAMSRRMQTIGSSPDANIAGGPDESSNDSSDPLAPPRKTKHTYIDIPVVSGGPTDRFGNPSDDDGGGVGMQAALQQRGPVSGGESSNGGGDGGGGGGIPEHIRKLLGPVEKSRRGELRDEASMDGSGDGPADSDGGISDDGPLPLWMEKKRLGAAGAAAGAVPYPRLGTAAQAMRTRGGAGGRQQQQQPQTQAGPVGGMICTVNVINHTDATLLMIAVDGRTGQRVNKTLYPKQTDSFDAPAGCLISVINPVTERALFRHKVLEQMTTLAVTDAVLLRDGEVGSTGKWWDSRAVCIAVGASAVAGVVGIALLILYLVLRAKRQGSGGGSGSSGVKL